MGMVGFGDVGDRCRQVDVSVQLQAPQTFSVRRDGGQG